MDLFLQTLQKYFGHEAFRSIQRDIIESIAAGHDTLGLMPTGGGKSITFQVPAMTMDGVCLVITPLIALMNDQVAHLRHIGLQAAAINSQLDTSEIDTVLGNAAYGAVKFLYCSPERLTSPAFTKRLAALKLSFIVVDEAHCISQWGHDFRPAYCNIGTFREQAQGVPVLALTASATPRVAKDIKEQLRFGKDAQTFQMSFLRKNIAYVVRDTDDKLFELLHILQCVQGSAIVYTRSRQKTKDASDLLQANNISATYYHAGLDTAVKNKRQQLWQRGEVRVMAATTAFGMGIDKPDVRLVIHLDCPGSLEEYYQEAGRAGRDGEKAYAVLLYNRGDQQLLMRRIPQQHPPREYVVRVYNEICYFLSIAAGEGEGRRYVFNEERFCRVFHHFPLDLYGALATLQRANYLLFDTDPYNAPRVMMRVERNELYDMHLQLQEDAVLSALFRNHGSLFSELTYIDTGNVARDAKVEPEQLHSILKELSQKGVIRYVPATDKPSIMLLCRRVTENQVAISRACCEAPREQALERTQAVIAYASNTFRCRAVMLSEYFGETLKQPCRHCDNCLTGEH